MIAPLIFYNAYLISDDQQFHTSQQYQLTEQSSLTWRVQ